MKSAQLISIFFIALFIFIIYQIFLIFAPFTNAIFWSAILAFAFFPLHKFILRKLIKHELVACVLTTLLIFLIVVPPVVVLLVNVTGQAIELSQSAANYVKTGELANLIEKVRSFSFVQTLETHVVQWEPLKDSVESWIINTTKEFGNFTATQVGTITKNVFYSIVNLLLMVFLVFIFLKDGSKIYNFLYQLPPLNEETRKSIFGQINETFAAVIRGQLLTSLVQATLAGLFYWIIGIPVPILFGLTTFISSLIPVIGAAGTWLPLVAWLVFQQAYVQATALFLFGFLVISVIDNLLKPAIIGEKTKLPYFLLFFGILGGLALYGIVGIFVAPVVLSLFFSLVKIYQSDYQLASHSSSDQ